MPAFRVLKPNKKYQIPEDKKERYLNRMLSIHILLLATLITIFLIIWKL